LAASIPPSGPPLAGRAAEAGIASRLPGPPPGKGAGPSNDPFSQLSRARAEIARNCHAPRLSPGTRASCS